MLSTHGRGNCGTRRGVVVEDVADARIVNEWAPPKTTITLLHRLSRKGSQYFQI